MSSSLTLNLGLRLEGETPITERYNRTINVFDEKTASPIAARAIAAYANNPIAEIPAGQFKVNGGPTFAGSGTNGIYSTPKANFSPRIGFAWNPGFIGKTVVRGGVGIDYFPIGIAGNHAPGFSQTTPLVATNDGFLTAAATLANPFPGGIQTAIGSSLGLSTFLAKNISFYNPKGCGSFAFQAKAQFVNRIARVLGAHSAWMRGDIGTLAGYLTDGRTAMRTHSL